MNKRRFGVIGEKIAQEYLINKKYKILSTNFYTRNGEIDIIAQKENCLVFIEVKTRSSFEYGTPAMAVNFLKKKHIKNTARQYIAINELYRYEVRIDVIEIVIKNGKCIINHIEGVM